MKILPAQPFTFEAGERAVLLLHGFTGSTADVRMLGRFLQRKGYTCHAPLYKGHGAPPEKLLATNPLEWWQDALGGYHFLREKGHEKIAVCGLSLGGVFALKLGYTERVEGIVSMCAPMTLEPKEKLAQGVLQYARDFKRREGKAKEEIEREMRLLKPNEKLTELRKELIREVRENLVRITAPLFVVQGRLDDVIDAESADIIYENAASGLKFIKWYEQSGHVITFGREKNELHEDIYQFFERLPWS